MIDPKKLQDAIDDALKGEVAAHFHQLISQLVDAERPQPKGEPVRELVTFSFWLKMALVAGIAVIATAFQADLRKKEDTWEQTRVHHGSTKLIAVVALAMLVCIIFLGRLIAYDHIWGALSPATKA